LLGICPNCREEVNTAEGLVLKHFGPGRTDVVLEHTCEGTGEEMLPVGTREPGTVTVRYVSA
jgi:hypothetical protein